MAEYESIHGTKVKYLSSDPTLNSSLEGQVWYNSTSGTNKAFVQIKAWSSGGNLGTSRYDIGGTGTQTAALGAGGYGGSLKNSTEEYGGSSWLTGGNMGTARYGVGMAGTQTAGLAFGGNLDPGNSALTESWNGTNWTEVNDLNQVRNGLQGNGTSTASFAVGGAGGPSSAVTEEWNGSNWAEVGDLNTARTNLSSARAGTTTNALAFAGAAPPGVLTATEEWSSTSTTTKTVSTD